jgi:hypothetical protein
MAEPEPAELHVADQLWGPAFAPPLPPHVDFNNGVRLEPVGDGAAVLVATQAFAPGDLILRERPVLVYHDCAHLISLVKGMTVQQIAALLGLGRMRQCGAGDVALRHTSTALAAARQEVRKPNSSYLLRMPVHRYGQCALSLVGAQFV